MKHLRKRLAVLTAATIAATGTLVGIGSSAGGEEGCIYPAPISPVTGHCPKDVSIKPGQIGSYRLDNVPAWRAYAVDVSPIGATTTTPCRFEVVRQWDQRNSNGEREFWVQAKNVGSITCKANALLSSQETLKQYWSTGSLSAGQSITAGWNNTPLDATYFAGVSPQGATSTSPCEMQVTRQWYRRHYEDGKWEREFYFTIKNVGSITCWGYILLGYKTASWNFSRTLEAGATEWRYWNNNWDHYAHNVGLRPVGDECKYELLGYRHVQQYKSDGTFQQRLLIGYKNISSYRCSVDVHIAAMAT